MIKTLEQMEEELNECIPRSVVSQRDGGGGRSLSYLEGWYVIDRLNKIFGPLSWSKEIVEIKEVVNKTNRGEFPAYLAKVRLTLFNSNYQGTVIKEAYGYGADKNGLNAHELAIKEAVTDALKVAAKDLGMSLGLALYDKSQENVTDDTTHTEDRRNTDQREVSTEVSNAKQQSPPDPGVPPNTLSDKKLQEAIKSYIRIGEKTDKINLESFRFYLTKGFKVERLSELSTEQLQDVLEYLRNLLSRQGTIK